MNQYNKNAATKKAISSQQSRLFMTPLALYMATLLQNVQAQEQLNVSPHDAMTLNLFPQKPGTTAYIEFHEDILTSVASEKITDTELSSLDRMFNEMTAIMPVNVDYADKTSTQASNDISNEQHNIYQSTVADGDFSFRNVADEGVSDGGGGGGFNYALWGVVAAAVAVAVTGIVLASDSDDNNTTVADTETAVEEEVAEEEVAEEEEEVAEEEEEVPEEEEETEEVAEEEEEIEQQGIVIEFDPGNGEIYPLNNKLYLGLDGTQNLPVSDQDDRSNPVVVYNDLDGSSNSMSMRLKLNISEGVELDLGTLNGDSIIMLKTTAVDGKPVAFAQLTYDEDFSAEQEDDFLILNLLKPLDFGASYALGITDKLKDINGNAVRSSTSYEDLSEGSTTTQYTGTEGYIQQIINNSEDAIKGWGIDDGAIFSAEIQVQSGHDWDSVIENIENNVQLDNLENYGMTVAQVMKAGGVQLSPDMENLLSMSSYSKGELTNVPYYASIPTMAKPYAPLMDGIEDDPNGDPTVHATFDIPVQITVPNLAYVNPAREASNLGPISEPEDGWPVAVFSTGIGGGKGDMLGLTAAYSHHGIATVTIDHPLHGELGFDIDGDGVDDINVSEDVSHYLNLNYFDAAYANMLQSIVNPLALRYAVNGEPNKTALDLDGSQVSYLGISLGAMIGIPVVDIATSQGEDDWSIDSMVTVAGGAMIVPYLMSSETFSPMLIPQIAYVGVDSFKIFVDAEYGLGGNGASLATLEQMTEAYGEYRVLIGEDGRSAVDGFLYEYTLIAQPIIDRVDPLSYAKSLGESGVPILIMAMVGDDVAPATTPFSPMSGLAGLADVMGLERLTESTYNEDGIQEIAWILGGEHSSLLDPVPNPDVTQAMQMAASMFASTDGTYFYSLDDDILLQDGVDIG